MASEASKLIDFLIERTKDAKSPLSLAKLSREYKERRGMKQTVKCFRERIQKIRTKIHSLEKIDMDTKIKLIFALSAPVNADFLKKFKEDALVDVDEMNRITHYKANDDSLELKGDHSLSAKMREGHLESERCHLEKIIRNFSKNNDDADKDSEKEEKREMRNLIKFITEKCKNVDLPFSIQQLAKDFVLHFGVSRPLDTIRSRIRTYCRRIQQLEDLDTVTKVKQLFGLSVPVDLLCLDELRKSAKVEIDEQNRITHYKANDGSLELKGDHSVSAKTKTAQLESTRVHRKLIQNYFENKDNADGIEMNNEEREMSNLIDFITEKCENANSPLSILQLSKDFNSHFGTTRHSNTIRQRIKGYCQEIQLLGHLDTQTKVKQLFGLSASVDSNFMEELRKEAIVEVDDLRRITKYTANDNSLILHGDHSVSAKTKLCLERIKKKTATRNSCDSDGDEGGESEEQDGYTDEDCDEYSSEEFDIEFNSDNENLQEEPEDQMNPSTEIDASNYETPVRRPSINDSFDYDQPTERPHGSKDTEMREEEEENYSGNTENALRCHSPSEMTIQENYNYDSATERSRKSENTEVTEAEDNERKSGKVKGKEETIKRGYGRSSIRRYPASDSDSDASQIPPSLFPKKLTVSKELIGYKHEELNSSKSEIAENENSQKTEVGTTRSGRVSKKRVSDVNFYQDQENIDERISCSKSKICSVAVKTPESSNKRRKAETTEVNSPKRNRNDSMRPNELDDYDTVVSNDDPPKIELQPFRGRILDNEHLIERDEDIRRIQKPYPDIQISHENTPAMEAPNKMEYEEVPVKEEIPMEEVKPVPAHNSKINFLEALNSLILFLDTPLLSQIQLKIKEKIEEIVGSGEVIQNNELILSMELMIARMTNYASSNLSESTESVSLREFLCHLKAAILNSKIMGLDSLLEVINYQIKDPASKDKNVPMEKVEKALQAILGDIFF